MVVVCFFLNRQSPFYSFIVIYWLFTSQMFFHWNVKRCLNNVWPVCVCEVENMDQNMRPFFSIFSFFFLLLWEVTRVFLLGASALWDFPACGLWLWNLPLIINRLSSSSSSTLSGLIGRGNLNGTSLALRARLCVSLYLARWKCATTTCYALRKICFCRGDSLEKNRCSDTKRFNHMVQTSCDPHRACQAIKLFCHC